MILIVNPNSVNTVGMFNISLIIKLFVLSVVFCSLPWAEKRVAVTAAIRIANVKVSTSEIAEDCNNEVQTSDYESLNVSFNFDELIRTPIHAANRMPISVERHVDLSYLPHIILPLDSTHTSTSDRTLQ